MQLRCVGDRNQDGKFLMYDTNIPTGSGLSSIIHALQDIEPLLDSQGNPVTDSRGNPIPKVLHGVVSLSAPLVPNLARYGSIADSTR